MSRSLNLSVAAALLALVLTLGLCVSHGWGGAIDHNIATALGMREGQSSAGLINFWQAISWIGGGTQRYIIVALLALFLWLRHHWRLGAVLAGASLLSSLASDGLKLAFARARPDLVPHLDHASSFAFPSGHATSAAVVYLLFAFIVPTQRRGLWLSVGIALTLLTGMSRIMLGVHWPSDVIGGWLLGAAFAFAGLAVARVSERPVAV
jgi:membrane-associated phospholipid phosphatase